MSKMQENLQKEILNLRSRFTLHNHLESLMTGIQDTIVISLYDTRNSVFVSVSSSCKDAWGYSPEEMAGKSFKYFCFKPDIEVSDTLRKRNAFIKNFRNRYIFKDTSKIIYNNWICSEPDSLGFSLCLCTYRLTPFPEDLHYFTGEARNLTLNKFKSADTSDVLFEELLSLPFNQDVEIAEDCWINIAVLSPFMFKIYCSMKKGTTLDAHYHSNFLEGFQTIHGEIINLLTNNVIDNKVFDLGEPHKIHALSDWKGVIYGFKPNEFVKTENDKKR